MFETLQRLYNEGKLNLVKLNIAVSKGWITKEERGIISGVTEVT